MVVGLDDAMSNIAQMVEEHPDLGVLTSRVDGLGNQNYFLGINKSWKGNQPFPGAFPGRIYAITWCDLEDSINCWVAVDITDINTQINLPL